ncbi:MAG TPA: VOC family protein [Actinomycetota bacterium]|nr:VOC family protein [Actinomycetota bacterium]
MQIDHAVYGVQDLEAAASRMKADFGLGSVQGGHHPGWGTGNRIVPLGPNYIELLAAVDEAEAESNEFGQSLLAAVADGDRLLGWCVSTEDVDAVAARLELPVTAGSRVRPDGTVLRWRSAGLDRALAEPSLPFFITWDVPQDLHPGRAEADHVSSPHGITWLEIGGDALRLNEWLAGSELPVRVVGGPPGVLAVGIAAEPEEIVLR